VTVAVTTSPPGLLTGIVSSFGSPGATIVSVSGSMTIANRTGQGATTGRGALVRNAAALPSGSRSSAATASASSARSQIANSS